MQKTAVYSVPADDWGDPDAVRAYPACETSPVAGARFHERQTATVFRWINQSAPDLPGSGSGILSLRSLIKESPACYKKGDNS